MSKPNDLSRAVIPEHLMLGRLAQSEQMRECFLRQDERSRASFIRQDERSRASFFQMWLQNPVLAKQGGSKVQNLLSPLAVANAVISPNSPTGFTVEIEGDGK
jgi:hypothetical protein